MLSDEAPLEVAKKQISALHELNVRFSGEAQYARRFAQTIETVLRAGTLQTTGEHMLRILLTEYRAKYPKEKS